MLYFYTVHHRKLFYGGHMAHVLKCGECGRVDQSRMFIDDEPPHDQRCPGCGSTLVDTPAAIARLKHGGTPGEQPTKRRKHVAA